MIGDYLEAMDSFDNVIAIKPDFAPSQCMKEGWNQNIDSNKKRECPSLAFFSLKGLKKIGDLSIPLARYQCIATPLYLH